MIDRAKRSKTLCEVKPVKNISKNLQSFLEISPTQNEVLTSHLNIHSIAGKFDQLKLMVKYKVDMLVLTETKIDSSFLNQQFHIEGFCLPYRLDRNKHGGGVLVYLREDIPSGF